jgi:hypothetical protein
MGFRDWWDPQPPDGYANRPPEFQHKCPLPLPQFSGMTWVCEACGCPWVVRNASQGSAEKVVMVDPQRPWLGTKRVPVTYWYNKPHWRFDSTTYSRWRDYPLLDREKIRRLEEQISGRVEVDQCVVSCPLDPSLSCLRPILWGTAELEFPDRRA